MLRFSFEMISFSRVSSPMQTKASEKKTDENIFATPGSSSLPFAPGTKAPLDCSTLKTSEAATKPRMNFGNFSQTIPSDGFWPPAPPRAERYSAMKKATTPINTFWAALMITACWLATSPTIRLDAATPDVVSIVPPIHAPATSSATSGVNRCGRIQWASHGIR